MYDANNPEQRIYSVNQNETIDDENEMGYLEYLVDSLLLAKKEVYEQDEKNAFDKPYCFSEHANLPSSNHISKSGKPKKTNLLDQPIGNIGNFIGPMVRKNTIGQPNPKKFQRNSTLDFHTSESKTPTS